MSFKNLNFDKLQQDTENFILTANDSYYETYPEFLKYFEDIDKIEKHHLIISSHFVYGWMPTIIKIDTKDIDRILSLLNAAKAGQKLKSDELSILKHCINNSLVGLSKLLHFINPREYAIWDRRIFRYLTEKKSQYGIGNVITYLDYLQGLKELSSLPEYSKIHSLISSHFIYPLTPMRAIEIVMFEADRKQTMVTVN